MINMILNFLLVIVLSVAFKFNFLCCFRSESVTKGDPSEKPHAPSDHFGQEGYLKHVVPDDDEVLHHHQ